MLTWQSLGASFHSLWAFQRCHLQHHSQHPNILHDIKRDKSVILLTLLCKHLFFGKIFFSNMQHHLRRQHLYQQHNHGRHSVSHNSRAYFEWHACPVVLNKSMLLLRVPYHTKGAYKICHIKYNIYNMPYTYIQYIVFIKYIAWFENLHINQCEDKPFILVGCRRHDKPYGIYKIGICATT